jgi:hypothetical protein
MGTVKTKVDGFLTGRRWVTVPFWSGELFVRTSKPRFGPIFHCPAGACVVSVAQFVNKRKCDTQSGYNESGTCNSSGSEPIWARLLLQGMFRWSNSEARRKRDPIVVTGNTRRNSEWYMKPWKQWPEWGPTTVSWCRLGAIAYLYRPVVLVQVQCLVISLYNGMS